MQAPQGVAPTRFVGNRASLNDQNQELRSHLHTQSNLIGQLSEEVDVMRNQLREALIHDSLDEGSAARDVQVELEEIQSRTNVYSQEMERLQHQLNQEKCRQESATEEWLKERMGLQIQINQAKAALMNSHRQRISQEKLNSQEKLDAVLDVDTMERTFPFHPSTCGTNVSLSEDNYTVSRTQGCRQSVAIGSGPLARQKWGWYFEVTVRETLPGWTGGLGIGMTRTAPDQIERVADKAWRIPSTYVVGYWGCAFIEGEEVRVRWCSDRLQVGARVGVLITSDGDGDLIVFVDDKPVVRVNKRVHIESEAVEQFYPIVDVFAATRAVTLSKYATTPDPPWNVEQGKMLSSRLSSRLSSWHSSRVKGVA